MIIHCQNYFGVVWVVALCSLNMVPGFHDVDCRGDELAHELVFEILSDQILT